MPIPVSAITSPLASAGRKLGNWLNNKDAKDELKRNRTAQERINAENMAFQREMYEQNRADMKPWLDSGAKYLGRMTDLYDQGAFDIDERDLVYTPGDIKMDPGYQFRVDQATKALQAASAARGNRLSGGSMAGLSDYISKMASDEYNNAYNRQYGLWSDNLNRRVANKADAYGRMSGLAGMGMSQANNLANVRSNFASNMGNLYGQMGQNQNMYTQGRINANQMSPMNQFFMQLPGLTAQAAGAYFGRM